MGLLWDLAGPVLSFLGISRLVGCLFLAVTQLEKPPCEASVCRPVRWSDALPRLRDYTGSMRPDRLAGGAVHAGHIVRCAMRLNAAESSFFIVYLRDIGFAGTAIGAIFSIAEIFNGLGSLTSGRLAKMVPHAVADGRLHDDFGRDAGD